MRTMYDDIDPSSIPVDAVMVAGYVDGHYVWPDSGWARFPNAVKVRIAVFASTNDGHVLDVEATDSTPAQAVDWVRRRRAAGCDPSVYCSRLASGYAWQDVRDAFAAAGEAEPHYWIADYDGQLVIPARAIAHQYADSATSGGAYDLSVVADYWPGVDPAPVEAPMLNVSFLGLAQPVAHATLRAGSQLVSPTDVHLRFPAPGIGYQADLPVDIYAGPFRLETGFDVAGNTQETDVDGAVPGQDARSTCYLVQNADHGVAALALATDLADVVPVTLPPADTGTPLPPTLDEAAIRADQRAKDREAAGLVLLP